MANNPQIDHLFVLCYSFDKRVYLTSGNHLTFVGNHLNFVDQSGNIDDEPQVFLTVEAALLAWEERKAKFATDGAKPVPLIPMPYRDVFMAEHRND